MAIAQPPPPGRAAPIAAETAFGAVPTGGRGGAAGAGGAVTGPSISLPKGGGAIRGIGEKFAANPVTGTGSMSVPIATSPGRSGFGPQLSLSYDSGAGNGPFGFGWSLSLPSITRKTDKGLPQYRRRRGIRRLHVFLLPAPKTWCPCTGRTTTAPGLARASGLPA